VIRLATALEVERVLHCHHVQAIFISSYGEDTNGRLSGSRPLTSSDVPEAIFHRRVKRS
jgi:hypothetical protein